MDDAATTIDDGCGRRRADGAILARGAGRRSCRPLHRIRGDRRRRSTRAPRARRGAPALLVPGCSAGALPDQLQEEDAFREFEGHFYRNVDDEDEHLSTVLAGLELLRHGTTAFLEPGTVLEVDAAVRGAELTGIRAVLADSFIWDDPEGLAMGKNSNPERNTSMIPRAASDRASVRAKLGRILERNADPRALVTGHVAVLGLGTASTDLMLEAKRVANDAGVVLNFHQSYSPGDTARDHERLGAHPIVALRDLGIVDARTTMAHVNHITDRRSSPSSSRPVLPSPGRPPPP